MKLIEYTKEQQSAINYFDNNLLISASAGSGKTQVLLEKVVKLIENGTDLNEILMVTFTNLASSEMKAKLENMLIEKLKVEDKNSTKFFNALNKLNSCDISTLHGFCQKLVREYYYFLNIEPNFDILEEGYLLKLKNLALDSTIKFYLESKDEEFTKVSNLFVVKRDYTIFKTEILKFYEFLVSKLNKYDFIQNLIVDNYNLNINENNLFTTFKNFTLKKLSVIKKEWEDCILKAEQINSETLKNIASSFYGKIKLDFKNNEEFINFYLQKAEFKTISIKKNAEFEEIELKEYMQNLAPKIKTELKNLVEIFGVENLSELKNSLIESEKILNKIIEIIKKFEENFSKLKTKHNALDFNDLEILTLKLFENKDLEEEISKKYKFIFVDEYQDTNSVQEEILKKVSKFSKRIMVGDIKQSIYAFRECNPKIFSDKMIDYNKNESLGKVILLNKNFRSKESILNFSNLVFSNLMREENCEYSYKESGKFVAGVENDNIKNTLKPVNVICIEKQTKKKNLENNDKTNLNIIEPLVTKEILDENENNIANKNEESKILTIENSENLLVVSSIYNLLNQKIKENNKERNLTFSDIAILSRKRNAKIIELIKTLDEFKIPYSVKYKEKLFKSFEVKLILSYLNLLNNADNDIALVSVLKNIYDFTSEELLTIKTTSLLEGLKNYSKKDDIFNKITQFFNDLNTFKAQLYEISIKELIVKIIKKLKLDVLLIKLNGKISEERINLFVESVNSNSLSLVEFLLNFKEFENKEFEVKKTTGENAVIIDTFHSSKGLEYNAVIIYSAGEQIFSKNTSNFLYNAKFGVGVFNFDTENKIKKPSSVFNMIKELNVLEELNEETRLSYVAFTRAKNFLVIIGKEKLNNLKEETLPINFLNFNSYLSLVFATKQLKEQEDFSIEVFNEDNLCEKLDFNGLKKENAESENNKVENLNLEVFEHIKNKKYEFENSKLIQLKNSVTSFSEQDKQIYNISNFKLTDNDNEDFIELGNAYHEALEKLPFYINSETMVKNKLDELISLNLISANIYSYVDCKKLYTAICEIKKMIGENDKVYKEHTFMLYVPYNKVAKNNVEDKILVQGIIDLFIEKDDEIILIDYKTSRLNDINLIKKYNLQLSLYALALKEKFKNKKISKYIYSIFLDKLINIV